MNIEMLLRMAKEQRENPTTMHNQNQLMNGFSGPLERHEMKPLKTSVWVIPKELQFPFNPIEPADESFNTKNRFRVTCAPTDFVIALKQQMREDAELHKYYAKLLGVTPDEYDISTDTVTAMDFKLFNSYTVPLHLSSDTQKFKTADCGKFGMERLSPLERDNEGNLIEPEKYIAGKLLLLENAIRSEKIAEFYLKVDEDKTQLSSDNKDRLDTIKKSTKVTYPKKSGVLLFIEYACKKDSEGEDILEPVKNKETLDGMYRYINCNPEELKKISKKLGKKKTDKFLDYITLKVSYGDGVATSDQSAELVLYNSREYEGIDFAKPVNQVTEDEPQSTEDPAILYSSIEAFNELVIKDINDGLEGKYDALAKKNIWKFRRITDSELLALYQTRVNEISDYITDRVYNEHFDIIELANPTVAAEIKKKADAKQLPVSYTQVVVTNPSMIEAQANLESLDNLDKLEAEETDVIDSPVDTGVDITSLV